MRANNKCGINVGIFREFTPKNRKIIIDFDEINWNDQNQLPTSPVMDNAGKVEKMSLSNGLSTHLDFEGLFIGHKSDES